MSAGHRQQLLDAALSEDPTAKMRTLAQRFLDAGTHAEQLLQDLDAIREAVPEQTEESVLEVMDLLTGWCAPSARLTPRHPGQTPEKPAGT